MRKLIMLAATLFGACALPDEYDYDVDMDATFRKESPSVDANYCWSPRTDPLGCDRIGATARCVELGFEGGDLAQCVQGRDYCRWNVDACTGTMCGDGVTEGSEECDLVVSDDVFVPCGPVRLAPATRLVCGEDCTFVDSPCPYCGDGVLDRVDPGDARDPYTEECDFAAPPSTARCSDYPYFLGAEVPPCSSTCERDMSVCTPSVCGDGVVDDRHEECDTAHPSRWIPCEELRGAAGAGTAICVEGCYYDTQACRRVWCGDSHVDAPEEDCDPSTARETWCEGRGAPWWAACERCEFPESICAVTACGDGIVGGFETCESGVDRSAWICPNGVVGDATTCNGCHTFDCERPEPLDAGSDTGYVGDVGGEPADAGSVPEADGSAEGADGGTEGPHGAEASRLGRGCATQGRSACGVWTAFALLAVVRRRRSNLRRALC